MSDPESSKRAKPLPGIEYATPVPPTINLSGRPKLPFTPEEIDALSKPKVLISGGGIGGLTLALLLHKANIPFLVLERAKEIKPLGSAIAMGCSVTPLFKQLGIFDELAKRGKHVQQMHMYKEDLTPVHTMEMGWIPDVPDLYDILFNSIPRERILLGKRVLSFIQNDQGVLVRCSDNSTYHGEILVGADGAYSAVRQQLYKELKADHKLPLSDDVALPFSCWVTFTTKQNTLCWMVINFLDKEAAKINDSFRTSEWGPEAAEALAREVRMFKVPGGKDGKVLSLGDYIDKTPRGLMSKVMLEEIVFDTWYGGRTVLLGDACHKMNPAGALGAVTAIHDAVTLANWLSTLRMATEEDFGNVFKEYRAERYPVAKANFVASQGFIKNLGKNVLASVIRGMIKMLPPWLWRKIVLRQVQARHQASFLPLEMDRSKVRPLHQPSLHKTLPILKKLAENTATLATESAPIAA
ncbi:hypothetical protein BGZ92_007432 [Podila epicladia]|nr:hypothetical protein BGZ92_007432 [Podila epicladia]